MNSVGDIGKALERYLPPAAMLWNKRVENDKPA